MLGSWIPETPMIVKPTSIPEFSTASTRVVGMAPMTESDIIYDDLLFSPSHVPERDQRSRVVNNSPLASQRTHDSLISSAVFKTQNFQTPLKQKLTAYQPRFSISDLNIDDDPLTAPSTIQRLKRSFIDRQARQKCSKFTTFLASDSPKSQESFSSVISECSEDDGIDELLG